MTYYTCFDQGGDVIARCQTQQQIAVLREMGRPISKIQKMRQEEAVVCSLTGSPAEYDEELRDWLAIEAVAAVSIAKIQPISRRKRDIRQRPDWRRSTAPEELDRACPRGCAPCTPRGTSVHR